MMVLALILAMAGRVPALAAIRIERIEEETMATAIAAIDAGAGPVDLVLDSPGGSVVAAGRLIMRLEAARLAGRRITATVTGRCLSACVNLLAEADRRMVAPGALVAVHAGSHPDGTPAPEATLAMVTHLRRRLGNQVVGRWIGQGAFRSSALLPVRLE